VKSHIGRDVSCTFRLCGKAVRFLVLRAWNRNRVPRRKVPTFKRRVIVALLVHRFVKALSPTKPPPKLDATPVDVKLVDKFILELPKSTRRAMDALPTKLVEEEALVIDMKYALVHDYNVLHKGKNDEWIVTRLDAIQMR